MTPPFVRPDVRAFLDAGQASGAPPLNELPVELARAGIRQLGTAADADPRPLPLVRDLACPGPGGAIALRLYDSRLERDEGPAILYFHGGGFVFGDLDSHDSFCRHLAAELDLPVLAVDYRLAPEHPFPAFVDDAEAAARWLASSPPEIGRAVSGIATCGDSAGGHLAIAVAQQLAEVPAAVPVIAQLVVYPYLGGGTDWESVRRFGEGFMVTRAVMDWFDGLCGNPGDDPRYCLLRRTPPATPLLVQTASLDPLRDQGAAYADAAREAGARVIHIEAEGMIHGFVNLRKALPSAQADVDAFISAARAMLKADVDRP
ncbi:acetyl esterase [Novosphingobium sp. CF614]|uniref:alpha/beta hydrolase n=1 Tax=Novosphingobium sp. CF614 TaxID=1884364 RepID=UPI0008F1D65D|nr:alpha/beta hydrolase [Novosphingobium sp. CF614]SFF89811.1 acetyl esterase [Novosphingobium sp. CF614]